jgi:hypothetical protein
VFTASCLEHVAGTSVDAGSLRRSGDLPSGESFLPDVATSGSGLRAGLARRGDDLGATLHKQPGSAMDRCRSM